MTKCRAYSHEKLNTSKRVIRSRELALATEEEIASARGKQGVTNIRISIRKSKNESRPTLTSWHLSSPILPTRWRSALVLWELSSTSQFPWGASNAKNMNTPGKPVEVDTYVPNAVKRTRPLGGRLLEANSMCKLLTRLSGLCKIFRCLQK